MRYNNDSGNDDVGCINMGKELHIAPMLDVSTREFRQLMRILSKRSIIWTEMVVDETLAFCEDPDHHLGLDEETGPLICQLGGNHATWSGAAVRLICERYSQYTELNFNMDCPSQRVSGQRQFGAVLMKQVDTAIHVLQEMKTQAASCCFSEGSTGKTNGRIIISVKTRIGIDDWDDWDFLVSFISRLTHVCQRFYMHGRKCLLQGLNPAQNRSVPPLNYPWVYRLCHLFPHCDFYLNGGIHTLRDAKCIAYGTALPVSPPLSSLSSPSLLIPSPHPSSAHGDNDTNRSTCRSWNRDRMEEHQVPCQVCQTSNGSCTAPPLEAPGNLRGVMMGRAAMDDPAQFWDVDRYMFGDDKNPCRNRHQVLELYCTYLERTYPRRCCDTDSRLTTRIPAPKIPLSPNQYCDICKPIYYRYDKAPTEEEEQGSNDAIHMASNKGAIILYKEDGVKISSRVMDRSLKPILGMFYNLPGAKVFRRRCHELSRDLRVRNCGPGCVLRMALASSISPHILHQDFVPTIQKESSSAATMPSLLQGDDSNDADSSFLSHVMEIPPVCC
eukprot:scaffold19638_cov48-Attheya_sp.AAC.1